MTEPPAVLTGTTGSTTTITLNRPHRLNAVTLGLYRGLLDALEGAETNPAVRVIVLTGAGRAFCVGADLKDHGSLSRTEQEKREYAEAAQEVCTKIQESARPVISMVRGYAFGAGAEMALSSDFVIMEEEARIGFPEISIGTYIGGGLSMLLPQLVGMAKARELLFLGERISGREAADIGLIYRATPEAAIRQAVDDLAERLAALAPVPLTLLKQQLRTAARRDPRDVMSEEVDALLRCMATEDWAEGVRAFAEKRKPVFKGI